MRDCQRDANCYRGRDLELPQVHGWPGVIHGWPSMFDTESAIIPDALSFHRTDAMFSQTYSTCIRGRYELLVETLKRSLSDTSFPNARSMHVVSSPAVRADVAIASLVLDCPYTSRIEHDVRFIAARGLQYWHVRLK